MSRTAQTRSGIYCLPTATKFHMQDLERSVAHVHNQFCYLLTATQTVEEGGYPAQVVLMSPRDLGLDVDENIETQHAEVRKNLPPRRVSGIIFSDGERDGIMPHDGVGLPHWEFIETTSNGRADQAGITAVKMRVLQRRQHDDDVAKLARETKSKK